VCDWRGNRGTAGAIRADAVHTTVLRWARWARAEVEAWPDDLSELDATAEFSRIVSAASRPERDPDAR
jgi:hypothetical protein